MRRVGRTELLLVEGGVPHYREMVVLGREISRLIVDEYGADFLVERLADPFWLSCLSCVLGFEWNTSGQTTVTLRALKDALKGCDLGIVLVGGKGEAMRETSHELKESLKRIGREDLAPQLLKASTLSCKIDNNAVQDSYNIYFHSVAVTGSGSSAMINQGMNIEAQTARRYQWLGSSVSVEEPHTAISSEAVEEVVLDLTSRQSRECRYCILDVLRDSPIRTIQSDLARVRNILAGQTTLDERPFSEARPINPHLRPPKKLDDEILRKAKENAESFESLLLCEGVGPATLRGLAYISELVYGARVSWKDPARYAYAFGTKSGSPYPVDRRAMVKAAETIRQALESSDSNASRVMLRRLGSLLTSIEV
ncbi:hypothetical protein HRbin02_00411 [Candidatus Calditenuaceae archaeon HR02]|nr:hypothetical protein HRbin02_00411 [Candidatus Calditenuaceae archaeon HR02]